MKFGTNKLSSAVRLGLSLSAVIAMSATGSAFAQDTSTTPPTAANAQTLKTVVVTGSHIRRVDIETASPVVTIDRQTIAATGKVTLGDLIQQLPAMTGGNTNPQVNNGGGNGTSSLGLRGLGANRTLVLVDGQRINNNDPNTIPASMIERIDVLTDGASAVYGSDAIGGVVNFITRKNYQGAELAVKYGESDRNDGESSGYSFTFGQTSDKGSIMGGIDYNKMDGISSARRPFSQNAVSFNGTPPLAYIGGSSSSPYGHVQLPSALAGNFPGCTSGYLARNPSAAGLTLDQANYHCYANSGSASDKFNYASYNLILTPQARTSAFLNGTYALTDNVSAYLSLYHTKASSASQLAPGVYGTPYGAVISADNYYNPAGNRALGAGNGIAYGGATGLAMNARLSALGNRGSAAGANTDQVSAGFKGDFNVFSQDWQWNAGLNFGHYSRINTTSGLPNTDQLYIGPSFLDSTTAVVTCGTPGAPISGCNGGFNPFDLDSPTSTAALKAAGAPVLTDTYNQEKVWHADVNGGLFDLPAGTVQLAAGGSYRQERSRIVVSPLLAIDPTTGSCTLGSQCTANLAGGYNVKEVYAEAFIPILKDLPLVQSLNVTLGDRYSRFSTFGSTNNAKIALEWKPITDLLLRGTVAQVFRAPNIAEVFGAPSSDAPNLSSDPCDGYTGSPANPACVNVPTNGSFVNQNVVQNLQLNTISGGSKYSGFPIKPEQGKSFDLGAVYSPSWIPGLSATVDVWHLYLNDIITSVGAQSAINLCSAGQLVYCPFINRFASGPNQGQLTSLTTEPTGNLGAVHVGGVDASLRYALPDFDMGKFSLVLNGTYQSYYNQDTAPGTSANTVYHDAGHFMPFGSAQAAACPGAAGGCLFPRIRAQGGLDWQLAGWNASWRVRYISPFQLGSKSPVQDVSPAGSSNPGYVLKYPSTVYNDISIGYDIKAWNTRVDFGVNNLTDRQPPFLYANNTGNANSDPTDYDFVGRYFWGRVTLSF